MKKIKLYLKAHPKAWHVLIIFTYLLFTFYYMTPQALHCNTTVYGFGDNTAGPIWRYSVSPSSPLGGFEKVTNYPFGDNLYAPASYSAAVQYTAYWGLAKVAGPLCGYNIVNFTGFVMSAAVMYGLIFALTRRRSIAWLAGYAVSFSPYFQVKSGNHMGYGYEGLLIGIIWAFYSLMKHQRKKPAIVLGALTALCFYFDPYFSLLAGTALGALGLVWVGIGGWRARANKTSKTLFVKQAKMLALSAAVAAILLVPLGVIAVTKSHQIATDVAAARGNVLAEARDCSILPYEYASPFVLQPIFTKLFGGNYYKVAVDNFNNHFRCGIGEDTVGISLTILAVVGSTLVVFGWEKLNKRRLKLSSALSFEPKLFVFGVMGVGLAAVVMALPPLKAGPVPMPSYVLLMLTSTWRTLARFYVLVNISAVILFSVALAYLSQHFRQAKRLGWVIFVILFLMIFVEYQAFKPLAGNKLSNFNYNKDVPSAYIWLSQQKDVHVIAEYPLEREGGESDAVSYYLSMQMAHKKKMLNSALPNSPQEDIRSSIKDLSDPQTIPVLEKLGVDTVVVHGLPASQVAKIPHLKVLFSAPQSSYNLVAHTPTVKDDMIVIAKLQKVTPADRMMQLRTSDFPRNANIIISSADWQYEALQNSRIDIKPVIPMSKLADSGSSQPVCFAVRMSVPTETDHLSLIVDGQSGPQLTVTGTYQPVRTAAAKSVVLHNASGHNMEIENLGCPS